MKMIFLLLTCAFFKNASAQPSREWLNSFIMRPAFEIGDVKNYDVNDMNKAQIIFFGGRSEVNYRVQFAVTDTSDGGWWLQYRVHTLSAKDRNLSLSSLIGTLSDGLTLMFYMKGNQWKLDSLDYFRTKARIATALDSAVAANPLPDKEQFELMKMRKKLTTDLGLENFLGPMLSFVNMYEMGTFKKYKQKFAGCTINIFHHCMIDGMMSKEWVSVSETNNTAKLVTYFTADETSAAKYYNPFIREVYEDKGVKIRKFTLPPVIRNVLEHTYIVDTKSKFPVYIFEKNVVEIGPRVVNKMEMKETQYFY